MRQMSMDLAIAPQPDWEALNLSRRTVLQFAMAEAKAIKYNGTQVTSARIIRRYLIEFCVRK